MDTTTQVDYLTHHELRRRPLSAQPGTTTGEKPSATPSACFNLLLCLPNSSAGHER